MSRSEYIITDGMKGKGYQLHVHKLFYHCTYVLYVFYLQELSQQETSALNNYCEISVSFCLTHTIVTVTISIFIHKEIQELCILRSILSCFT